MSPEFPSGYPSVEGEGWTPQMVLDVYPRLLAHPWTTQHMQAVLDDWLGWQNYRNELLWAAVCYGQYARPERVRRWLQVFHHVHVDPFTQPFGRTRLVNRPHPGDGYGETPPGRWRPFRINFLLVRAWDPIADPDTAWLALQLGLTAEEAALLVERGELTTEALHTLAALTGRDLSWQADPLRMPMPHA